MKKIISVGCLHGYKPIIDVCDILIITGNLTARDSYKEYEMFDEWLKKQKADLKIVIGGNHDNLLENKTYKIKNGHYLENEGIEYKGFKFFGIPYSLSFSEINPKCTAFCGNEKYMKEKSDLIPEDIDILISHSPPFGILDEIEKQDGSMLHVGSTSLRDAIFRIKPKLVIFSHIHENGGKMIDLTTTICVNCSIMNERYEPVNKPMRIEL